MKEPITREVLSKKLKDYRKKEGMSQQDLADKIGSHVNNVNRWERMENGIRDGWFQLLKIHGIL